MRKFLVFGLLLALTCGSMYAGEKDTEKTLEQQLCEKGKEITKINEKMLQLIAEAREIYNIGIELNEKYKKKEATKEEVDKYAMTMLVRIFHIQKEMDVLYIEVTHRFNEYFIIQEAVYLEELKEAIKNHEKAQKEEETN